MINPDTQPSLIVRLSDKQDRQAWEEFSAIYRQVIYRMAIFYGLQPDDAEDLCQKVFLSISQSIDSYRQQPGKAKFRTWLKTVARNEILNSLTRSPKSRGREIALDTGIYAGLAASEGKSYHELNYRREVFLVAASQARQEFSERSWRAFWLTAVEQKPLDQVCEQLGMSRGSIYTARCRIVQRLRDIVQSLEEQDD
jgi:RNA polymerase sigma-70 factor, ECF subfamily